MISKKIKIIFASFTIGVLGVSIVQVATSTSRNTILYGENQYTLNFLDQKISDATSAYVGETTATVKTNYQNPITFKASNVIENVDGWQTVLPGGYFYNPIDGTANHNKINGMKSVTFTAGSNVKLSMHYGYTIDNEDIIYSRQVELTANSTYNFEESPCFIYFKNEGSANVDINNLAINYSCVESGYSKQTYNVLMIGNSFSDDTIFYANRIANAYGITLNIFNAYIASCTIDMHYANLTNGTTPYSARYISNGSWQYINDVSLPTIIGYQTWDVITFQQASSAVGRSDSYSNLSNLVNAVRTMVGSGPKFYWNQTWAYDHDYQDYYDYFSYFGNDQMAMYNAIIDCYEDEVASLGVFDRTIFAGTAVQNMRTSYMKDTFTRDGKHMSSVHGRYLLGLNLISTIFDIDLNMSPALYKPNEVNIPFVYVAYESIKNAYRNPLDVTNSAYTSMDIGEYDLSQYTEIDAELVGCSYWNSTDANNYNKRISNGSGSSNLYTTTKRFTSSTLPVGSLVIVDEAFGIRPEAWTSDAQQSTRPAETYQNVLEITSSFWSGYEYRAFNIFKAGMTELKGQYDQIFDGFHIYVPNSSLGDIKPKGYNAKYNIDKMMMKNSSLLNIDAFERMHLDPITGFYKCDSYYDLTNSYSDDTAKKFMCSRPFYSANNDLPENTVIIVDEGYQWRSDCWGNHGTHSRPSNVTGQVTVLDSSFWTDLSRRTFNVSSTSSSYVGQNYIDFFNHMRIYTCVDPDNMYLEPEDTVTMTVLGNATLNAMGALGYGKSNIPVQITLSGDDISHVKVYADGSLLSATEYSYNKTNGALTIETSGNIGSTSFNIGTITGTVDKANEKITGMSITGNVSSYVSNNGSITLSTVWHDSCNYSTNAASQAVWQRRYMKDDKWQYNSGSGDWTTSNNVYRMEDTYSMGLRIANNSYDKTSFILKSDFSSSGLTAHGISVWIHNPHGEFLDEFRLYVCDQKSTAASGYVTPNGLQQVLSKDSIGSGEWINIQTGFNYSPIYNISIYFDVKSNVSATNYVYLGHVSIY